MARVLKKDSQSKAASRSGGELSQTTVSRWVHGKNRPSYAKVVAFAEAYGEDPYVALEAAGLLPEGAGDLPAPRADLSDFDVAELAEEVARRLKSQRESDAM